MSRDVSPPRQAPRVETAALIRTSAVVLVLGAAAIHLIHAPIHFEDAALYGWFFLLTGSVQLGAGLVLLKPRSRAFYLAAASFSLSIIGLWAITRTAGIPVGLRAGIVEPAGAPDLAAAALELLTAALLLGLASARILTAPMVTARAAAAAVLAVTAATAGLVVVAERNNRVICHHHNPDFGPLAALEGHSILPQGRPPVPIQMGRKALVLSGFLINCGSAPVEVTRAQPLSFVGDSAAIEAMTSLDAGHRPVESSTGVPSEGRSTITVPPSIRRPDLAIYSRVAPIEPGLSYLNAVKVTYRYRGKTASQPLATSVAFRVAGG